MKTNKYGYWDTGWKTVEENITKLARVTIDSRTNAPANVFDWENGMSLKFYGEKKKFAGNDFVEPGLFSFVERGPLSDEALSHSVDLSQTIRFTSPEDMEKLISGKAYAVEKPAPASTPVQTAPTPVTQAPTVGNPVPPTQTVSTTPTPQEPVAAPAQEAAPIQVGSTTAAPSGNVCPFAHAWGEADKHSECATCELWEKCLP